MAKQESKKPSKFKKMLQAFLGSDEVVDRDAIDAADRISETEKSDFLRRLEEKTAETAETEEREQEGPIKGTTISVGGKTTEGNAKRNADKIRAKPSIRGKEIGE